uniref:Sugar transporter SWEET1 n=1 Tax=Phytophthora ramorum TaxID=164328 RepID=H3GDC8_PHYRM
MAMQGPEFLPQSTSLTPLVRGEARPLLAQSYGVKVTSAAFSASFLAAAATMLALDVVNIAATVTTIVLLFSPSPDFRRIRAQKSTGEVRILPVLMLGVNCYTWAVYGFLNETYFPVMSINALGAVTSLGFSVVFYRWSSDRASLHKTGAAVALWVALVLLFVVLCRTDVISLAADVQEKVVGYVAVAINVCLYASPLQTMTLVLRTKSAASLPATMCCVNLVNGSLWVLYGILADDMFVLSPNALGVALSVVQVALCVKFRHSGRVEAQDDVVDTKCEALILSPVDGVALDVVKSPVYEPVRSPV